MQQLGRALCPAMMTRKRWPVAAAMVRMSPAAAPMFGGVRAPAKRGLLPHRREEEDGMGWMSVLHEGTCVWGDACDMRRFLKRSPFE